jgi:putative ABC transport system substrate-binding protein
LGLIASLARPGGNITGLSSLVAAGPFTQKQLELLKEMVPGVIRVAVLRNPTNPMEARGLPHTIAAAEKLGLTIQVLEARTPEDIDRAFEAASKAAPAPSTCMEIPCSAFTGHGSWRSRQAIGSPRCMSPVRVSSPVA